jgi:hypothetical protein
LEHNSLYYCIEDVLPNHWDPLNISDAVWPHNKYEMYIPAVFTRALNALGSEELVQFLYDLALKEFGVKENKVKMSSPGNSYWPLEITTLEILFSPYKKQQDICLAVLIFV